jgi:RNA polymerase sigma-70 factor (ECF subfamily)
MNTLTASYYQTKEEIAKEQIHIEAAKQDATRFSVLYEKYYLNVFRYIFRRINNEDLTADLTSQVFYKALNKISTYKFKGLPFASWLIRIAYNEMNLHFRKKKSERVFHVEEMSIFSIADEISDEEEKQFQLKELKKALQQLSVKEMELIEMRFFEQRSFKEVAEILDITENNAKVKVFRIIKKLQNIIKF